MTGDQWPTEAGGGGERLPARPDRDPRLPARPRPMQDIVLQGIDDREGDPDEIDLLAYWRILAKHRYLVLATAAGVAALALLYTLMATPIYRATAVIQIEREGIKVLNVEGVTPVDNGYYGDDFLQTQYELLRSRSLAERVAEDLGLPVSLVSAQSSRPSWSQRFSELVSARGRKQPAAPAAVDAGTRSAGDVRSIADIVQGGLDIEPVRDSRLVHINFDSPTPAFAARVANAVADGFIATGLERRFDATSYAKRYLEDQLKVVKSKLEDSERNLVDFAQKEQIVAPGQDGQTLVSQNLTELNAALAQAQDQRIRAEARWRQAQSARGAALPADMLGNSIVRSLQQQRADLQTKYQQQLQVFKPGYPAMQQLQGEIAELDKQIAAELSNIRSSVKAEYDAAAAQEGMLNARIAGLRDQSLDLDKRSIQYNILKREVDTNRQLYDGLLQRYKEIGVSVNESANNVSVVDRAEVPSSPYKPSLGRNLVLGLGGGLLLGVLLAFVREYVDDTIKSPGDIEQRLRLAVLGAVPEIGERGSVRQAAADPRSAFSESYRSVRTALQFSSDHGVPGVLLLTSAAPGEGKSVSALMLARNLAHLGKRVLLIEADLRKPSLHRELGIRADIGLSSVLSGSEPLASAIQRTDEERLSVVLSGPLPPNPAELLSGSRLVSLIAAAAEEYDQIVIDGPPVIGLADALILGNVASATVFVVHAGRTRISTAQQAVKRLLSARAHLVGALLTRYDPRASAQGYQYESYYAYGESPRLGRD